MLFNAKALVQKESLNPMHTENSAHKEQFEIVLADKCSWDEFFALADNLAVLLPCRYSLKLNDVDSAYYDFRYKGRKLTLHYHNILGVTAFARNPNHCSPEDKAALEEIEKLWKAQKPA